MATKYRLSSDELSVEESPDGKEDFVPIGRFKTPKDALSFLRLKEGRYTEVTDVWLSSEAFFQRFKTFAATAPLLAKKMSDRIAKIV